MSCETCGGCLLLVPVGERTRCVAPSPRKGMGHARWLEPATPCSGCSRKIMQQPIPFGGGFSE